MSRSAHRVPLIVIGVSFIVSRLAIYAAGVRFDASSLPTFWQYIDPPLLKHHLLQSLFYLHSQPPLYNLWLGVLLKLFPGHFAGAAHATYLTLGLALAVAMYFLLTRLGFRRAFATAVSVILSVSPAVLLYENWLFYEYPVAVLLVLSVLALHVFATRRSFWSGFVFFGLCTTLIYTRTTFQLPWLGLVLALILLAMPKSRRVVLVACAVPVLAVALLYGKNIVVFGTPSTSSWLGMNLAQVTYRSVPAAERNRLVANGTLSRVSLVDPFSPLSKYDGIVTPARRRGIPVLDNPMKLNGTQNLNDLTYVKISRDYLRDSLRFIRSDPIAYLRGVEQGVKLFLIPSSDDLFVLQNRAKIRPYEHLFNGLVYLRTPYVFGIGWSILAAYVFGGLYGLILITRLALRLDAPTPDRVALAFAWLTVVYATVLVTFGEVSENQRIRFFIDPLVLVLVAVGVRGIWSNRIKPRFRASSAKRSQVG